MASLETIVYWNAVREELELLRRMALTVTEGLPQPLTLQETATTDMHTEIFDDAKKLRVLSEYVDKGIQAAGVHLRDDETYACMFCVVKKPKYASEVTGLGKEPDDLSGALGLSAGPTPQPSILDPTPEPAQRKLMKMAAPDSPVDDFPTATLRGSAWRSIRYHLVMQPAIMEGVIGKREQEKIAY